MTMQDNIRLNKVKAYENYDNYDAIEVPFVSAIPSDYDGVMGVPITFLDKYSPEQFEIVTFIINDDGSEAVAPVSEVIHTHTHTGISRFCSQTNHQQSQNLSENPYSFKSAVPGLIKCPDATINERIIYARISIRHKKTDK